MLECKDMCCGVSIIGLVYLGIKMEGFSLEEDDCNGLFITQEVKKKVLMMD